MPGETLETFSAATRARFGDEARTWLSGLSDLIADLQDRWSLELGDPSSTEDAYLVPAERGGDRLVLGLAYPDGWWPETTRALEAWRGDGTVRLFEQDPHGARLLERHAPAPQAADQPSILRDVAAVA